MDLAKPHLDVALFTGDPEKSLAFWRDEVGLAYEELLPTGGGNQQHRFGVHGSVLKVNHPRAGLPQAPPSGYRELVVASAQPGAPRALESPDGVRLRLVPPGHEGVVGLGVRVAARDAEAQARFYGEVLGLPAAGAGAFRCGDSWLWVEQDATATPDAAIAGPGLRYLTVQVRDCAAAHRAVLGRGGREGAPPRRMGEVAIFSMVRDPDGNWIELSQRASLTGPLG